MVYIFSLLESMIFPFYLIVNINQKYTTNINNTTLEYKNEYHAHDMSGRHVGLHAKVIWPTAFFLNSEHLFVQHLLASQQADMACQFMK